MIHISTVVAQFQSLSHHSERRAAILKDSPPPPNMSGRGGPSMDACVLEFLYLNL